MQKIIFNGNTHPIRDIIMPFGCRTISTVKLNELLLTDNGNYVSEEARLIDETIFYFVEEDELQLDELTLVSKIMSEL